MTLIDDQRWHGLASVARALSQSARVDAMLAIATDEVLRALGADSVSVSRLEPGTWTLRTLINGGSLGPDEERLPEAELYRLEDFAHFTHVYRDQRVWVASIDDPHADPADVELLNRLHKGSSITAPVVVDGVLWGELYASWRSPTGALTAMHDGYLEALSAVLGGAISRALHMESLEQLAFRDPLTGLANRRALDLAAQQLFSDADLGPRRRISVVAADINDLKVINDTVGHHRGDLAIKGVAAQLLRHFTPLYGSLTARFGGDEFTVLVPGHPFHAVKAAADALCREARSTPGGVSVSCGIASTGPRQQPTTARHLFATADQAMYQAKRTQSTTAVVVTVAEPYPDPGRGRRL